MFKKAYHLGYLGYLFLLILSVIFYKERVIFTDTAFHLFYIVRESGFFLEGHYRYGAVLTQAYPLLASKLGLSLNAVAMLYSMAFVINSAFCYFLCGGVFRNYKLALVLLLFNTLFISDVYFWPVSELQMGTAVMLVFFSYLSSKEQLHRPLNLLAMAVGTFLLISFFHPLMIFAFLFVVLFLLLSRQPAIKRSALLTLFVFFIASYLLKEQFFVSGHDKEASSGSRKIIQTFPHYFDIYSNKEFLKSCLTRYCWIPISSLVIAIVYIRNQSWLKMCVIGALAIGYILLVNISYPSADVAKFYIENFYTPLGVLIALPLVFDVLPALENKRTIAYVSLLVIMVSAAVRIYSVGDTYVARLNWQRSFMEKYPNEKVLVAESVVPRDTLIMVWGTPYEFWALSTMEQGTSASIIVNENVDNLSWALDKRSAFLATWGLFEYSDLPQRYFKFTDTVSAYRVIK